MCYFKYKWKPGKGVKANTYCISHGSKITSQVEISGWGRGDERGEGMGFRLMWRQPQLMHKRVLRTEVNVNRSNQFNKNWFSIYKPTVSLINLGQYEYGNFESFRLYQSNMENTLYPI